MNAKRSVLVIAPDDAFRRSLAFALEAEGFAVESHSRLASASASPFALPDVSAVVDEEAIKDSKAWDALVGSGRPVILLCDAVLPPPLPASVQTLRKPLTGNDLFDRINDLSGTTWRGPEEDGASSGPQIGA